MKKILFLISIILPLNLYATALSINNSDISISDYDESDHDTIEFQTNHKLNINNSNSLDIYSITTIADGTGILDFNTNSTNLNIIGDIGTDDLRIGSLDLSVNGPQDHNINSVNSGVIYLQDLKVNQDNTAAINIKILSGSAIIDTENLDISQNLILNNQANIGSINFKNQNASATFANAAISGDVSQSSVVGSLLTTSQGSISFNGSDAQSISVSLGSSEGEITTTVNQLNINNSHEDGIVFSSNNNNYVQDMIFNHNEEDARITLHNTIFYLNGNITNNNSDIDKFYILSEGTGGIILTGKTQNVDADFGQSASSRFNDLQIQSSEINFSGDLYLNNLNIVQNAGRSNGLTILNYRGILDVFDLKVGNNLTINGDKTLNINNINFDNSKNLTLNVDANISGNITESNSVSAKIFSNNNNITFNGSSSQNIAVLMGDENNRIKQISNSNSDNVTLAKNVFVEDVAFTNESSGGKLLIASGFKLDVIGNITALNPASSFIAGTGGTLDLTGSGIQNITAGLGANSESLNNLNINNNNVVINNGITSYIDNLNLNSGSITLNSGSIIDVKNSLDLQSKTINYAITSTTSNVAKITSTSSNEIATHSSNINIDYRNILGSSLVSYLGTSYDIIDNNTGLTTIDTSNITLTDNSYLANPVLTVRSSDKILTLSTNLDKSIFNTVTLGQQNYDIINYILTDLGISNPLSITNAAEFKVFQNSIIIPRNNSNIKNNINLNQNIALIIDGQIKSNQKNIWGNIIASNLHHKTDSKQNGFDANNAGFIFGYHKQLNKNNLLGSAIFYANSNIATDHDLQDDQTNTVGLSLYHKNYNEEQKGLFSFNKLTSFYNFYSLERNINLGNEYKKASASTTGLTLNLETGLGYKYNSANITYTPKLSYQYFRDQIAGYEENNAGNLSLKVSNNIYDSHRLKLGLDITLTENMEYKTLEFKPKFGLYLTKNITSQDQAIDMNFINSSTVYEIKLPEINDDYLTTIVGIDLLQKEKMPVINLKYIGNFSSDISSHLASINFRYNF
tara:strand:- start:13 stop:3102 length:3090 start_codon:yes stop_codon:yes gene_type:complete